MIITLTSERDEIILAMKKILIITSHPNKDSLTFQNANITEKKALESGIEVTRIEASDLPLMGKNLSSAEKDLLEKTKNSLLNSDYIAIFTPLWNFGLPGALKNFLDVSIVARLHFRFRKFGIPQGLIKAKCVYIFYTSGTSEFAIRVFPFISALVWNLKLIFFMCGVKKFKVYHLGSVEKGKTKKEDIEKWFKKIAKVDFK
ncbi:NAD(P)H-dependent oxidoreductase [Patescibacteria group bacterium]|nr:NAD(P)H-dependent oxidoreductase [Patescibacteria group bacterium]